MSSVALGSLLWFMGSFIARNEKEKRNGGSLRDELPRFQVPATMNGYNNDWADFEKEKQKAHEEKEEQERDAQAKKMTKAQQLTDQSSDEIYGVNPLDLGMDSLLKPQLALFSDIEAAQAKMDASIPADWHGAEEVKGRSNINEGAGRMSILSGEGNPNTRANRESYATILGPQDTTYVAPSDIALQYSYAAQNNSTIDNDARPVEPINDSVGARQDFIDLDRVIPRTLEQLGVEKKTPQRFNTRHGLPEAEAKAPRRDLVSTFNHRRPDDKVHGSEYLHSRLDRMPFQGDALILASSRLLKDRDMKVNRARYDLAANQMRAADPNLAARLMNRGDFGSRRKTLAPIPRAMYQNVGDVTGVLDTTPQAHEGDLPQLQNKELMLRGPRLIENFKSNSLYIRDTMPLKPTMKQFNVKAHPGYVSHAQSGDSTLRMPRHQTKQSIKELNTLQTRLDGFGTKEINTPLHNIETSRPMKRKDHDAYRDEVGQEVKATDVAEQGITDHHSKRQQFRYLGNTKTEMKPYLIQGQSDRNTQMTNMASMKNTYGIDDEFQMNPYETGIKA